MHGPINIKLEEFTDPPWERRRRKETKNKKKKKKKEEKEEEDEDKNTFNNFICDMLSVTDSVLSQDSPCGFCGRQSGNGRACSPSTAVPFCQDHSMDAGYLFAFYRRHLNSVNDSVVE